MNRTLELLKPLILELQELPNWPGAKLPAGLLLYDVMVALDATRAEMEEVLGWEVLTLVEGPTIQEAHWELP
jgi:hypothetical protein